MGVISVPPVGVVEFFGRGGSTGVAGRLVPQAARKKQTVKTRVGRGRADFIKFLINGCQFGERLANPVDWQGSAVHKCNGPVDYNPAT
jgi:hypothetical protein